MTTTPTIALFDIDGTLVSCAGAGRRAMERAFGEHGVASAPGRPGVLDFDFGGMTDRAIVRRGLEHAGRAADDAAIDDVIARYLTHLEDEVPRAEGYRVLPGALALVERLCAREGHAIGLGTGNVEHGARVKLARGGLHGRFAFGGFGSDHEDRARLLGIGAERGAARLGRPVHACRVIVIGDTPRDVAAALAIGATCLAVGTGRHDPEALLALGAHAAVPDLEDPRALALFA